MHERIEDAVGDLAKIVRGDVFTDILHRAAYASDASIYQIIPGCVVAPRDAADVAAVVKYACAHGIAIAARGAGSGLAGESLCSGIVFDMRRYMNKIIDVEDGGAAVICEPGVVLDDLNNYLSGYGRKIGPDPSSGNRATVGGSVANNATGAHSLEYGYIGDYVESVEAVLADGSVVEFKNDFDPEEAVDEKLASIAKGCAAVLSGKEAVIANALPVTKRNRSGYSIAGIYHDGKIDLARLLAGSEGTLGIFTKVKLRTVAVPKAKGLLQLEFDSLIKMAQAVPIIVDSGASACELMDRALIDMAVEALPEHRNVLPTGGVVVILVEHTGETAEQVREKIENTDSKIGVLASGRRIVFEPRQQKQLWKSRKDSAALLERRKGRKRPVPFIEDVSVENRRLAEYISGLEKIGKRYDVAMSFYGHAGDGELHVRPYLDLGDPADVEKMRSIANDVFSLAWSLGGTISGEHAVGLVRAAFLRRQYGDEFYELLRAIKNVFDPSGVMNPGKIISDDADVMVRNLRAGHKLEPGRLKTDLHFGSDEFRAEIEQCSGCGVCLSRESDLRMCPVFRAMGEELGSSRAKANVLRLWITGELEEKDFESAEFRKFLDLCVNCKACSVECPAGVDISKLMTAARTEYVRRRGLRRAEISLSHNRYLSMLGSIFSPISNFVTRLSIFKWFLEQFSGLDRRRSMPSFGSGSFVRAGRKYLRACAPIEKPVDKVAYFVDTYANYNDHELGFAVLEVLRHNGIDVILPKQRPVPLPAIVYGNVKRARKDLEYNVKHLAKAVRDGYKIVCSEPSAALCLKQELKHFVAGEDAKLVCENTYELMIYLSDLSRQNKLKPVKNRISRSFVYHQPCHLYALGEGRAGVELLKKVCYANITELDSGCCGIAGTFGFSKKNYELSSQISARLKDAMEKSPVKEVLTECAACKMQIEHISGAAVVHPIKILAEAYRSM
ncbi:MAG: anaerobic glycerol-3-phosphate dehydrogenase subunit C [Phycisphaerae bacterium]|nr:anaerobic glycerol-3-phosphate dehydrogenase subunit C [Phycisphaerae bacterium]MDD5380866.1 anaerobic glycerol-3-phosphate dehydrogenase subunit C [Phycisphaerae bacterium]